MYNGRTKCFQSPVLYVAALTCLAAVARAADPPRFTKEQQLVIAAFGLDVAKVKALLADGANPNARMGIYDDHLFADKWTLAYSHLGSAQWTPLLAVANSHRAPQPRDRAENTSEGRAASLAKLNAIDPKIIRERDARRVEIAKTLVTAKADLDLHDGYGATALYAATDEGFEDLALLLIASGAEINTKTGIYIDGPGDITPLHEATLHPRVLEAMLKRGAKVDVADSWGHTPLHRAVLVKNAPSVKLLLAAGADVATKDKEGRTPAYWCHTTETLTLPGDPEAKAIAKLLKDAQAKK